MPHPKSKYCPSDQIAEKYATVDKPVIGRNYHLSWAYRAARFKLVEILDSTYCNVYTGETNNKTLKVKLADLRETRNRTNILNTQSLNK